VAGAIDPGEHRQADSRLHLAIATATGSDLIADSVIHVQKYLHDMLTAIPMLAVNIEHSNAQHAEIVAAICAGQADRARAVMEQHCDDTSALLRGLLR
jgi:GntR family transcriptional repressor for pyruvate dehydrogenase complex